MTGKWVKSFRCLIAGAVLAGAGSLFAGDCPVPFDYQRQEYWCWAASDQIAGNYSVPGTYGQQCDAANVASSNWACGLANQNCCANPAACNVLCTPQIQSRLPNTRIKSNGPFGWYDAPMQFNGSPCQPFIFAYRFSSGGTHFMVARGTFQYQAVKYLHVIDPNPIYNDAIYIYFNDYTGHSNTAWYNFR